jgi:L-ectoine synthase
MKVRTIKEIENTERDVNFKEGKSLRVVLAKDNMGFSIHKTIIPKGQKGHWHYKHHLESCYCIKGIGLLTNLNTNEVFKINVDTVYSLDDNDNHTFEALEDVVLISVFNPPVTGNEIHRKDGSYTVDKAKEIVYSISECTNDYDAIERVNELLTIK